MCPRSGAASRFFTSANSLARPGTSDTPRNQADRIDFGGLKLVGEQLRPHASLDLVDRDVGQPHRNHLEGNEIHLAALASDLGSHFDWAGPRVSLELANLWVSGQPEQAALPARVLLLRAARGHGQPDLEGGEMRRLASMMPGCRRGLSQVPAHAPDRRHPAASLTVDSVSA